MPTRFIFCIIVFISLQAKAQQSFDVWKATVYNQMEQPSALLRTLRKAGGYLDKNEAQRRVAFFGIDDSLDVREMHFERRLLLDTLVSRGKQQNLKDPILAIYMMRLANACAATDQGERAASILNELLHSKYRLSKLQKIECLMMLGNLELNFQLPERAISRYQKALKELHPNLEQQHPLIRSNIYNNIGLSFTQLQQIDSALYYHKEALKIRKREGRTFQMGQSFNNIGTMYYDICKYDSALVYYEQGLRYRTLSSEASESSLAESWTNIGKAHFRMGNIQKAKEWLEKSLAYSKRVNNLEILKRNYEVLHELYKSQGELKLAYEALSNFYAVRDSLYGLAETKEILHTSYKQELREQALSDSLNREANKKIFEEKSRKESVIKYGLGFALVGLLAILALLLRNYRNKVRSNRQISLQKNTLKEKNEEIIGSITYAKRLQDAILPSDVSLSNQLPDPFVFYQPKDIVAGDFYWMHTSQNQTFFAVSDCTGHGVPGALVSIVCSNALNRATKEFGLKETGEILDKTTELVLESFRESEENVNDGMDVSLVRIDGNKLQFSGAYNGLWIVTEHVDHLLNQLKPDQIRTLESEGKSLIEIKANRQPVGYYENRVPFTSVNIELTKGDQLYLLTDGFGDQFGGVDNKKYKASQLKRFLLEISSQSTSNQKSAIADEFAQWMGANEQVDDVCIAGIRIV